MITVIVPTFNRPDSLKRAVTSLFKQTITPSGFALIIVDNTPDASAALAIEGLRAICPPTIDLIALHEPAAGVANARNLAMSAVKTDLVAFLDDDQSAPIDWLERLLDNYRLFPAAVTFGPVNTALPNGQRRHQRYFCDFFARQPDFKSGYIEASFGCGNALIDCSKIPGSAPWFDTAMNESGGEDDILFSRVRAAYGQFAWAQSAPVLEHPPIERVTLSYTLKRAFSYGQAPITLARRDENKSVGVVIFWMLIGAAKVVWHGVQWLGLSLIRHPGRAFQLDRMVRGLGKLAWWIDLRFYGAAALPKKTAKSESRAPQDFLQEAEQV